MSGRQLFLMAKVLLVQPAKINSKSKPDMRSQLLPEVGIRRTLPAPARQIPSLGH